MNKTKGNDPQKFLVRNTAMHLPKTKVIVEEKTKRTEKKAPEPKPQLSKPKVHSARFDRPELNSALLINKKLDQLTKAKAQQPEKLAFCEKVTRKVNFPADKNIYKDLIPLEVPAKAPHILTSRDPLPQKDREPVLMNYTELKKSKEFVYHPSVKIESRHDPCQVNNLHLYKIMQRNSN